MLMSWKKVYSRTSKPFVLSKVWEGKKDKFFSLLVSLLCWLFLYEFILIHMTVTFIVEGWRRKLLIILYSVSWMLIVFCVNRGHSWINSKSRGKKKNLNVFDASSVPRVRTFVTSILLRDGSWCCSCEIFFVEWLRWKYILTAPSNSFFLSLSFYFVCLSD